MSPIVWLVLVDVILVAPITAWLATQKGRSPSLWFIIAAVAGPVALIAIGLGPPRWDVDEGLRPSRRCPECDSRISVAAVRCPACRVKLEPLAHAEPIHVLEPEPVRELTLEPERPLAFELPPEAQLMQAPEPLQETELSQAPEPEAPVIVTKVTRRRAPAVSPSSDLEDGDLPEPEAGPRGAQNLASGVFAGGASELVVGYRYLISVTARQLRISGPVDVAPDRIVLRAPRAGVEAAALGGDIVIGAEPSPGRRVQLVFRAVAGGQGNHLVAVLDRTAEPPPKRTRRSSRSAAS